MLNNLYRSPSGVMGRRSGLRTVRQAVQETFEGAGQRFVPLVQGWGRTGWRRSIEAGLVAIVGSGLALLFV